MDQWTNEWSNEWTNGPIWARGEWTCASPPQVRRALGGVVDDEVEVRDGALDVVLYKLGHAAAKDVPFIFPTRIVFVSLI